MTSPVPRDQQLLVQASDALNDAISSCGLESSTANRLRLLEGAAALIGSYSLGDYDLAVGLESTFEGLSAPQAVRASELLAEAILDGDLPPSLALASLADADLHPVDRRRAGRYFTDSRLALDLTDGLQPRVASARSILDPACGAGTLLVAAALKASDSHEERTHLVRSVLWGVDRDPSAIRAARLAISSLTHDADAHARVSSRLLATDSLTKTTQWWQRHQPLGFDIVVANPPWEKLRITRHEHALASGHVRHYGDEYRDDEVDAAVLEAGRRATAEYRRRISSHLVHQGSGETDLYALFLELGATLLSTDGALAFLVPAALIRNQGARDLRDWLFRRFDVDINMLDNRGRYFAIDSRFKFVRLHAKRSDLSNPCIRFNAPRSASENRRWTVETSYTELRDVQPDLAFPEVNDLTDWHLFAKLKRKHKRFGDEMAGWQPLFHREVDMTNDRRKFCRADAHAGGIPVIEGRMVHQHRVMTKRYVAGSGRRAEWHVQRPDRSELQPQWLIAPGSLRPATRTRVDRTRAGFCDITGQTNERTVLAALVPPGVVCGNKVPTIDFPTRSHSAAWVGIANSFVFDWLVRRSVTTTLNYFVVRSIPVPRWEWNNSELACIASSSEILADLEGTEVARDQWERARLRAQIEVRTARLYGVSAAEFCHILRDFPQVDRAQPAIPGEPESTITRDFTLASGQGWASDQRVRDAARRVALARMAGAEPFVANEHARAYRRM